MPQTIRVQLTLGDGKLVSRRIKASLVSDTNGVLCTHQFVGWDEDGPEPWAVSAVRSGLKLPYEFSSQEKAARAARRLWRALTDDERRILESPDPSTAGDVRTVAEKWKNVVPIKR